MGLSVSDKLAFIREYKKQGGKGNYLSAIKEYELGGKIKTNPHKGTLSKPINVAPSDMDVDYNPYEVYNNIYKQALKKQEKMSIMPDFYLPDNNRKFILKDTLPNGKPGIRNNSSISSEVVKQIAKKSNKYSIPIEDALAVGLRESNLMSGDLSLTKGTYAVPDENLTDKKYRKAYDPIILYSGWGTYNDDRFPKTFDRYIIDNNKISSKDVITTKYGTSYKNVDTNTDAGLQWGTSSLLSDPAKDSKLIQDYANYINNFIIQDKSVFDPFDKEMRFLSRNMGQRYNSKEKNRMAKLNREKQVLNQNPEFMEYAKAYYTNPKKQYDNPIGPQQ